MDFYSRIRPLLFHLSAESAHELALSVLRTGLYPPAATQLDYTELAQTIAGIEFRNPVGMAAGFDKNAEVVSALHRAGFGFVEAGTVTPRPQAGNPQPRMFRLQEDEAVINRLGFNNKGLVEFIHNLKKLKRRHPEIVVGANIGKNKDTENTSADYLICLGEVYGLSHYITINISSPNTPGLRSIQRADQLEDFIRSITSKASELASLNGKRTPLFLKIAPDLTREELQDICGIAVSQKLDALIVSNTTISRPESLKSALQAETGGLSGRPLLSLSTQTLREAYLITEGKIPLIGVGGIASAEDAYAKIRAGASLVQLYSALVYQGFGLVPAILQGLRQLLEKDGLVHIREAVGKG